MNIKVEFEGLDEIMKQVEKISTAQEIQRTNKKILETCAKETKKQAQPKIPESKNITKSGAQHNGSSRSIPSKHANKNIPVSPVKSKGSWSGTMVGWAKGDNEENFYTKFHEYGTSKLKPMAFMEKTVRELEKYYNKTAETEYEKLVKNRLE